MFRPISGDFSRPSEWTSDVEAFVRMPGTYAHGSEPRVSADQHGTVFNLCRCQDGQTSITVDEGTWGFGRGTKA